jgi:hypothetical protein
VRLWATGKATATGERPQPPFIWHMTSLCLEFPSGAIRHFPAGNYDAQMANWISETELELMRVAHQFWYAFKYLDLGQWGEEQTRLITWLEKKPPPVPPTRRLDAVIAMIWRVSDWAMEVMENLRR